MVEFVVGRTSSAASDRPSQNSPSWAPAASRDNWADCRCKWSYIARSRSANNVDRRPTRLARRRAPCAPRPSPAMPTRALSSRRTTTADRRTMTRRQARARGRHSPVPRSTDDASHPHGVAALRRAGHERARPRRSSPTRGDTRSPSCGASGDRSSRPDRSSP